MKNKTKTIFWGFFSLDYKAIETHLENMAEDGWKLEKVGRFTAKFKAIEPQSLKYYVDVFKEGGPFAADNHENIQDYRELCEASGWNFITSNDYLQFFYVQGDENPTAIQTDEVLEQKIVETSLWKNELSSVLFFFIMLFIYSINFHPFSYTNLLTFVGVAGTFLYPLLGIPMLVMGIYLLVWMLKARRNIKRGLSLKKPTLKNARRRAVIFHSILFILAFPILISLIADAFFMPFIIAAALVPMVIGGSIAYLLKRKIKNNKKSARQNMPIFMVGIVLASLFGIAIVIHLIMGIGSPDAAIKTPPSTYPRITFGQLVEKNVGEIVSSEFHPGMSPIVPRHYDYWETRDMGERREGFRVNFYQTIHPYFAQLVFEGKSTELINRRHVLANLEQKIIDLWNADDFLMTEDMKMILIQKGNRVVYIEGDIDFTEEHPRKAILGSFFEE